MSVIVNLHGTNATAKGYGWACDDPQVARLLNTLRDPDGPQGSDPDPDLTLGRLAVERFGAKIVQHDPPAHKAGRVY